MMSYREPSVAEDCPPESSGAKRVAALEVPYERALPWSARRGPFYLIVLLLFLNVVATTSITWGPWVLSGIRDRIDARRAAQKKAQTDAQAAVAEKATLAASLATFQKCLACELPAAQVIYSEEPGELTGLLRGAHGYSCVRVRDFENDMPDVHVPVVWEGPADLRKRSLSLPGPMNDLYGTVFLHERHVRSGPPRLIWVQLVASQSCQHWTDAGSDTHTAELTCFRSLHALVLDAPGNSAKPDTVIWSYTMDILQPADKRPLVDYPGAVAASKGRKPVTHSVGDRLRILAGRCNPTDPSLLSIDYTLEGRPGSIDILLGDDDRLTVQPHAGRKSTEEFDAQHGVEHWDPYAHD